MFLGDPATLQNIREIITFRLFRREGSLMVAVVEGEEIEKVDQQIESRPGRGV